MAWENIIVGYKIKRFERTDVIPVGAIFMQREAGQTYICGSYYPYEFFLYQIPIYEKKNIKTK